MSEVDGWPEMVTGMRVKGTGFGPFFFDGARVDANPNVESRRYVLIDLGRQEAPHQALEPVGEESRCGGSRTQADKRGATSAAGCPGCVDCRPEGQCQKCGAPRGADHDNACPTGSWKALESQCQPEDERESTEEACPECGRVDCPWLMPDIDALQTASEPIEALGETGIDDWSRLLLNLRHHGWELLRATQSEQSHTEEGPND
jgi:hypothetical protein